MLSTVEKRCLIKWSSFLDHLSKINISIFQSAPNAFQIQHIESDKVPLKEYLLLLFLQMSSQTQFLHFLKKVLEKVHET